MRRFKTPTAQESIFREQATITYVSGAKVVQKLGRGSWYKYLVLRFRGAITCAALDNTNAKTKPGDEWALVQRLEMIVGGDTVFSMSGEELRAFNRVWFRANPKYTTALGDGTTVNPSWDSVLLVPFITPGLARPQDTLLDTTDAEEVKLEVTFGTHTDVNGSATGMTTTPSIVVSSKESYGNPAYWCDRSISRFDVTTTGANTDAKVELTTGERGYVAFMVHAEDASGNDVTSAINRIRLKSGPRTFVDVDAQSLLQSQILIDSVEQDQNPTSGGALFYDDGARSSNSDNRSWYWLPMSDDGYLTESLKADGLSDLFFTFDVASACKVTVLAVVITPNPKAEALDAQKKVA